MNIDEFLDYYTELSDSIMNIESIYESRKNFNKMQTPPGDLEMYRLSLFADDTGIYRIYERKREIFDRLTARLKRGMTRLSDEKMMDYLVMRYFMRLKNVEICERTSYCERHIYRLSRKAKDELAKVISTDLRTAKRLHDKVFRKAADCSK